MLRRIAIRTAKPANPLNANPSEGIRGCIIARNHLFTQPAV